MSIQTLTLGHRDYVVISKAEYERLQKRQKGEDLPPLPKVLADGTYPAEEAVRVVLARKIITAREAAGLTQAELARRAGLRVENLNRIERAKVTPDTATIARIDKALTAAGQGDHR